MKNITSGIRAALSIPRDIVGGTKDYIKANNAVHKQALKETGNKQATMIANIKANAGNAPTPMGTNEFYAVSEKRAKELKKQQGISLHSSISKRLKNPND